MFSPRRPQGPRGLPWTPPAAPPVWDIEGAAGSCLWPRTQAQSYSELFAFHGAALHLPRYPIYDPGEARQGDYDYFFLRGHRYASCQAARFLLFGGAFLTLADEAAVDLGSDLGSYWAGFYREHFPGALGRILRYRYPNGYAEAAAVVPRLPLVSPHPFDSAQIPAERYYLADPGLAVRLNDKGRIHRLSPAVPRGERLGSGAFVRDRWRTCWPLPFVVKLAAPCGGGDGVALCESEADLRQARWRFAGRCVRVEHWIPDVQNNFNVQLQVTPDGKVFYIGGSVQRLDGVAYGGNLIDLDWNPPPAVAKVCDGVARTAAAMGWHGVCGLDLLEDGDGAVWLIDPNFRLNGSTPFFLLGDYLTSYHRRPLLVTGYFRYPGPPREAFDQLRGAIHRRELLPVGAWYEPGGDGATRLYAALVTDGDPEGHDGLLASLAERGLVAGIGL